MNTNQPRTLLLVGASGYVGGEILAQLLNFQPRFAITCTLRTEAQATKLASVHPSIHTVVADLDSHDLLVTEASNADVIIQSADCDHEGILSLLEGAANSRREQKPLVIQMSGTGSLVDPAVPFGQNNPHVLSDRDDQDEVMSLPESRLHIPVERKIYVKAAEMNVNVVVLVPGQIFGKGGGEFAKENKFILTPCYDEFVKRRLVWQIGEASATWGWTSVRDLGRAALFVLREGLKNGEDTKLEFGKRGIYFVGTGEVSWKERAEHLVKRLERDGVLSGERAQVVRVEKEESEKLEAGPVVLLIMGTSSRYKADRLQDLGFEPLEKDWKVLVDQGKFV